MIPIISRQDGTVGTLPSLHSFDIGTGGKQVHKQVLVPISKESTRAQKRALKAEIRQPRLAAEEVDKNAFRHPQNRVRCPRDIPARRRRGWVEVSFILPGRLVEGLGLLVRSLADEQHAKRLQQPHGQRRKYPRTKNFFVIEALNELLKKHGLSQFRVLEQPVQNGRVRRFTV
jgi:hypothetical protein